MADLPLARPPLTQSTLDLDILLAAVPPPRPEAPATGHRCDTPIIGPPGTEWRCVRCGQTYTSLAIGDGRYVVVIWKPTELPSADEWMPRPDPTREDAQ